MRGKVSQPHYSTGRGGITPAYAGKSPLRAVFWCRHRDHPRVCGEKRTQAHPAKTGLGSPPRMRGKETPDQGIDQEFGITPAYAGKRLAFLESTAIMQDHPRVCGEKDSAPLDMDCIRGSPPRMRGKGRTSIIPHPQGGITPAYAGKSGTGSGPAPGPKDHPRVCGEKQKGILHKDMYQGSPPRMRGKGNCI